MRLLAGLALLLCAACRTTEVGRAPQAAGPYAWTVGEWDGERVEALVRHLELLEPMLHPAGAASAPGPRKSSFV